MNEQWTVVVTDAEGAMERVSLVPMTRRAAFRMVREEKGLYADQGFVAMLVSEAEWLGIE